MIIGFFSFLPIVIKIKNAIFPKGRREKEIKNVIRKYSIKWTTEGKVSLLKNRERKKKKMAY